MAYIRQLFIMLQFMTRLPVRVDVNVEREEYGKSLATAPLVGLVIGLLMAGAYFMFSLVLPVAVTAVLTFAVYIFLTGGLHLDGLGDTADGLFSYRPKEKILEIMKDSRVGTNAVLTLILIILLDISLIAALEEGAVVIIILAPVAGRIGSLIGAGASSYAGVSDGPGRWCVEYCKGRDVVKGLIAQCLIFIAVFAASFFSTGIVGAGTGAVELAKDASVVSSLALLLMVTAIPPLSAFVLTRLLGRKLGGVTGDILGAVCELNQVVFMLSALILFKCW